MKNFMRIDILLEKYRSIYVCFIGMDLRIARHNFEYFERIANYGHHISNERNDVMCRKFPFTPTAIFVVNIFNI